MSADNSRFGPGCLMLFGLPFLLAGLGVAGWGVHSWLLYARSASWQQVPATVQDVEFVEQSDSDGTTYSVKATYQYAVGGKTYTGHRVDIMGGSSSSYGMHRRRYEELDEARRSGKPVTAWVDPNDAGRSLLYREADPWMYAMMPFGFVFAAAGTGVIALGFVMARRRKKLAEITAHDANRLWHARTDWANGQVRSSDLKDLAVHWGFGIGLGVFLSVFLILMASEGAPMVAWLAIGLFCLADAFLLLKAVLLTLRHLVHGSPLLYLGEVPIVPGRQVPAAVRTHKSLQADRWRVRLQCYVPQTDSDSPAEQREQVRDLVDRLEAATGEHRAFRVSGWRGSCAFSRDLRPAGDAKMDRVGRTMLPLSIEVPAGVPGTSLDPSFAVTWVLQVKARSFPLSFAASFELPVFYADEEELERRFNDSG